MAALTPAPFAFDPARREFSGPTGALAEHFPPEFQARERRRAPPGPIPNPRKATKPPPPPLRTNPKSPPREKSCLLRRTGAPLPPSILPPPPADARPRYVAGRTRPSSSLHQVRSKIPANKTTLLGSFSSRWTACSQARRTKLLMAPRRLFEFDPSFIHRPDRLGPAQGFPFCVTTGSELPPARSNARKESPPQCQIFLARRNPCPAPFLIWNWKFFVLGAALFFAGGWRPAGHPPRPQRNDAFRPARGPQNARFFVAVLLDVPADPLEPPSEAPSGWSNDKYFAAPRFEMLCFRLPAFARRKAAPQSPRLSWSNRR